MSDSFDDLISAIDDLVSSVEKLKPRRTSEGWDYPSIRSQSAEAENLRNLDAKIFALCQQNGLSLDIIPQPKQLMRSATYFQTRVPVIAVAGTIRVLDTVPWKHAMMCLRALAKHKADLGGAKGEQGEEAEALRDWGRAEHAEGDSKREVTPRFTAADQAARDLLESLTELKGVVRSIRNLPQQDLLTHGADQFRAWRYRFEAGSKSWLPAIEELMPAAAYTRARCGLSVVGRWSSAVEWLKNVARLGKETLEELDQCHPLSPRDSCPPSLQSLTLAGWVELAAHRLGGRITDELEALEPELRRDLELVKVDTAKPKEYAQVEKEQKLPDQTRRMTVEEANTKAMKLARKMRAGFFALSERQQAKQIGCSWQTWSRTPFYRKAQAKRPAGKRSKPPSPKTESLTAGREAVTGEGDKDEVLQQLIAEQEADKEPSPLETAPPNRPRKIHSRKRL
jgi:hypothetical protein